MNAGGMMLKALVVAAWMVVGCVAEPVDPAPVGPTEAELAISACEDFHQAHLAMCARCGITAPRPAGSPGAARKYTDCADLKRVTDVAALYDTCLPALASGCFAADTPAACHQFEF
jgi:hypothetical protein